MGFIHDSGSHLLICTYVRGAQKIHRNLVVIGKDFCKSIAVVLNKML